MSVFPGMRHVFPGMRHVFPGMRHVFPGIDIYIRDFGKKQGDFCMFAELNGIMLCVMALARK
jgi:hypothetical protein